MMGRSGKGRVGKIAWSVRGILVDWLTINQITWQTEDVDMRGQLCAFNAA